MPSTSTVACDTPLVVNVSMSTTVCPPMTVVEPFVGGFVGGFVEPVGPGPPVRNPWDRGRPSSPSVPDRWGGAQSSPPYCHQATSVVWNCGGNENGSRPEKIRARTGSSLRGRCAAARSGIDSRPRRDRPGRRGGTDGQRWQRRRAALAQLAQTEQRHHQHRSNDATHLQRLPIAVIQRHPSDSLARDGGRGGAHGRGRRSRRRARARGRPRCRARACTLVARVDVDRHGHRQEGRVRHRGRGETPTDVAFAARGSVSILNRNSVIESSFRSG